MRIITGTAKGCKLKTPAGMSTRPTSDRMKESLFSILGEDVLENRVLDIFAGTGGLGLEALSRGAASAVSLIRPLQISSPLMPSTQIWRINAGFWQEMFLYTCSGWSSRVKSLIWFFAIRLIIRALPTRL